MKKRIFNEAELYLIQHWGRAREFAKSMDNLETKYSAALQKIGDEELRRKKRLDVFALYITQRWSRGMLVFGRKVWSREGTPPADSNGFYLDNLNLDHLTSNSMPSPTAYIWISAARKTGLDLGAAKKKLWEALPGLFSRSVRQRFIVSGKPGTV